MFYSCLGQIDRDQASLEQFSIECRKIKTKVITLANHKERQAIHCPIKTRFNYTKRGKTCASFLSQSLSVVM